MKITKEQLAEIITGRERGEELTKEEESLAEESGLFVIFGYSDDNMEVRGVQHEEFGCFDGGEFRFGPKGVIELPNDDELEVLEKFGFADQVKNAGVKLEAKWGEGEYAWTYAIDIPHATFDVLEDQDDSEKFCRGIIIDSNDIN